jgi:hypothetical protein
VAFGCLIVVGSLKQNIALERGGKALVVKNGTF